MQIKEEKLWSMPYDMVVEYYNQIHKIIQDHTGQPVKMGQIYVQFSKHNCGKISLLYYIICNP